MKTVEELIQLVEGSVERALAQESNIEPWVFNIQSMSTTEIKCLLNNICNIDGKYLEIGSFQGGTFCSAISNNKDLVSMSIDNFCAFDHGGVNKGILVDNINRIANTTRSVAQVSEDCFTQFDIVPDGIDVYFYDGEHTDEDQEKALTYFVDKMSDNFVFIVDDYNGTGVQRGTALAIERLGGKIKVEKEWKFLTEGNGAPVWWNGIYVAVISKIK